MVYLRLVRRGGFKVPKSIAIIGFDLLIRAVDKTYIKKILIGVSENGTNTILCTFDEQLKDEH